LEQEVKFSFTQKDYWSCDAVIAFDNMSINQKCY